MTSRDAAAAAAFRDAQLLWRHGQSARSKVRLAALKMYLQAAKSGVPEYEIAFGQILCDEHYRDTADFKSGYKWILRAATKGEPNAQYWIARELATGENVKRNARVAAYWYRRAARRGLASARYNLGMMYFEGDGVPKNKALARRLIVRAAEHGEILAKMLLADAYNTGELGFRIDARKAAYWRSQVKVRRARRGRSGIVLAS